MVVSSATIRSDIFKELYNLINTNLTNGWTLLSSFPDNEPVFPCVILHPASLDITLITMSGDVREYLVNVEVEYFSKSSEGKAKIDEIRDNIQSTIIGNQSSLKSSNILLPDKPIDDSNIDTVEWNNIKYNTGATILSFMMRFDS